MEASPPPYSLLTRLDLDKLSIDSWSFLASYVQRYPAPSHTFNKYYVALVNSVEAGIKRRISGVLADCEMAHAIFRHGSITVIILRTDEERLAILAFVTVSDKCSLSVNQLEMVNEEDRCIYGVAGAWPLVIPYAATILPTPSAWYERGRPDSSGCLQAGLPKIDTLFVAAVSPKVRRAVSAVSSGVTGLMKATSLEKIGATIGTFVAGAPGAAAGTLAGKGLDGLSSNSGGGEEPSRCEQTNTLLHLFLANRLDWQQVSDEMRRTADEKRRTADEKTMSTVLRLIDSGKITAAEGLQFVARHRQNSEP